MYIHTPEEEGVETIYAEAASTANTVLKEAEGGDISDAAAMFFMAGVLRLSRLAEHLQPGVVEHQTHPNNPWEIFEEDKIAEVLTTLDYCGDDIFKILKSIDTEEWTKQAAITLSECLDCECEGEQVRALNALDSITLCLAMFNPDLAEHINLGTAATISNFPTKFTRLSPHADTIAKRLLLGEDESMAIVWNTIGSIVIH